MAAAASAAGSETPKQLLSIIRDFASEKSHGERRVSDLRRRLADARAAADAAAAELDAAKRAREVAEQELRGSQVQAAIAAASIQALEATISRLQEEISKVGSDLDDLKRKEDSERDEFISKMHEMNSKIRQFQQMFSLQLADYNHSGLQSAEGQHVEDKGKTIESDGILKDLADKASSIDAEVQLLEEEYKKDLLDHDKVHQELANVQARRVLMEAVMGETKQLQELGGYPDFLCRAVPIQYYSHVSMLWLKLRGQLNWKRCTLHLQRGCSGGTRAPAVESTTCLGWRRQRTREGAADRLLEVSSS